MGRIRRALGISLLMALVVATYFGYLSYSGGPYRIPLYNSVIRPVSGLVPNIGSLPTLAGSPTAVNATAKAKATATATTTVRPVAVMYITNSSQTRSISITNSTQIDLTGNYDNLTIYVSKGATAYLNVASNYNNIAIFNGTVYLNVNGNYNAVRLRNSTATNSEITGVGDSVASG